MELTDSQKGRVITETRSVLDRAGQLLGKKIPDVSVLFDLKGRSAGQFRMRKRACEIRYNPTVFSLYFDDNLLNTVPHEVAHYLVYILYPRRRSGYRRVKPHGLEWREMMLKLGADTSVCHNYDLATVPQRKEQRFSYDCGCRQHQISCRRHNKIQSGRAHYSCRYCNTELREVV